MTVLSGDAAISAQTLSDKEICKKCVDVLRKLFPEEVSACAGLIEHVVVDLGSHGNW